MRVLSQGAIYSIVDEGLYARCTVVNRADVTPEVGARCAAEMNLVLSTQVLVPHSPFAGMLFDVRKGPMAFGPKTRETLVELFSKARLFDRRISVRVGGSPTQRMQFVSLCAECAPDHARVFEDDDDAAWARGA